MIPAWPYNPHWAVWYDAYHYHEADQHPWAGHGWAPDGYMGHLQLAHFVPIQNRDAAHWRLMEGGHGFGDAQGRSAGSLEDQWRPKSWNSKMEKRFQELVPLWENLAACVDETVGPIAPFLDVDAAAHPPIGGDGN